MALPVPEGIVWFDRGILKNEVADLNDPKQFPQFALVEVVTNRTYDEGYKGYNDPSIPYESHPRASKQAVSFDATKYVRWHKFTCMVGPTAKDIKRQIQWSATGDARDFERRTKKTKVAYLPIPMPTVEERFLWIDLVFPVRAIYLPLSHVADQRMKRFASYIQLNLRLYDSLSLKTYRAHDMPIEKLASNVGKKVGDLLGNTAGAVLGKVGKDVGHVAQDVVDGQFIPGAEEPVQEPNLHDELMMALGGDIASYKTGQLLIKPDRTTGLNWRPQWTMRIDARALTEMLMIPSYMRYRIYASPFRYAKLFHASAVDNKSAQTISEKTMDPWVGIDYANVVTNHGGIVVDYKATGIPQSSIEQILLGVLTAHASALPVAGTVLSLGLGYLAEYLDDPDAMLTNHSLAKKGTEIGLAFAQGAWSVKKYYASGNVPHVSLPRRGPRRAYAEEDEKKSVYVGPDGENGENGKNGEKNNGTGGENKDAQVDTGSELSNAWVDPQRNVDMEDDDDMVNSSWTSLSYAPVIVEAAKGN
ncbi:Ff.00g039860.m01.CDS01 [Fusarium sp. VM40]|nr:Ff.00g039860.m01.CDS01 [Fusarium sp. VM40]